MQVRRDLGRVLRREQRVRGQLGGFDACASPRRPGRRCPRAAPPRSPSWRPWTPPSRRSRSRRCPEAEPAGGEQRQHKGHRHEGAPQSEVALGQPHLPAPTACGLRGSVGARRPWVLVDRVAAGPLAAAGFLAAAFAAASSGGRRFESELATHSPAGASHLDCCWLHRFTCRHCCWSPVSLRRSPARGSLCGACVRAWLPRSARRSRSPRSPRVGPRSCRYGPSPACWCCGCPAFPGDAGDRRADHLLSARERNTGLSLGTMPGAAPSGTRCEAPRAAISCSSRSWVTVSSSDWRCRSFVT